MFGYVFDVAGRVGARHDVSDVLNVSEDVLRGQCARACVCVCVCARAPERDGLTCLGMSWSVLECLGMSWYVLGARLRAGCIGMSWNVLECLGMSWTVSGCLEMSRVILEYLASHVLFSGALEHF